MFTTNDTEIAWQNYFDGNHVYYVSENADDYCNGVYNAPRITKVKYFVCDHGNFQHMLRLFSNGIMTRGALLMFEGIGMKHTLDGI